MGNLWTCRLADQPMGKLRTTCVDEVRKIPTLYLPVGIVNFTVMLYSFVNIDVSFVVSSSVHRVNENYINETE